MSDTYNKIYFNPQSEKKLHIVNTCLSFVYKFKKGKTTSSLNRDRLKHIMILESHLIGDLVMALPAYRAIRKKFPDVELIFWGNQWGKDLLEDQRLFDRFYITRTPWARYDYSFGNIRQLFSQIRQLRKLKIDMALDFRGDIRNIFLLHLIKAKRVVGYDFTGGKYWLTDVVPPPENWHLIERNLNVAKYIDAESKDGVPRLEVPQAKLQIAKEYFEKQGLNNIVFIHPGASQPKRLWSSKRFAIITEYLQKKGYSAVLLAGPNDESIVESIVDECNKRPEVLEVPLKEISGYLACGEFFIGLDSGIAHIAAALGKNIIVLFGPQPPSIACPRGYGRIIQISKGDFDCRPCNRRTCNCDCACMKAIQVEDVITAVEKIEINEQISPEKQ